MRQAKPDYEPLAACTFTYRTMSRAFEDAGITRL
jgi:hypothetical protein